MTAKTSKNSTAIHPTAIVDPKAELGWDVIVGPYAVIGADVVLGDGCEVMNHATIVGPTRIGARNRIFSMASIGQEPQDKKFDGTGESRLEIGDGNSIREFVTINRGTAQGGGVTRVGDNNWIMAYVHIAHDCIVGNDIVLANNATLGGHVTVQDRAYLGGFTAVHQFCQIGEHVMTGGHSMIAQDVPPFVMAVGNRAKLYGLNKVGLERHGYPKEEVQALERAYKKFIRGRGKTEEVLNEIDSSLGEFSLVRRFSKFIRESTRGVCR